MRVAIRTFGCSLNQADSEAIAGLLKSKDYEIVDDESLADVVIINSCTVKNKAENKFFKSIKELEEQGKTVILAGCVPQADPKLRTSKLKEYSIIGTNHIGDADTIVEKTIAGEIVQLTSKQQSESRIALPSVRTNPLVEIIPISEGCMESCHYCKTKHARGNQLSYRPRVIVERAQQAISEGVKEIWLTSQDCGSYGLDIGTNLVEMVMQIARLEGNFMIRVGMANPTYMLPILEGLVELFNHPKVYKFCHVPVQAGDDQVLKDMNRTYTVADFKKIVQTLRKGVPEITIATDIICGYPTESNEQFENTLNLIRELQIEIVNISRFWPRPNTPAARLHKHDGNVTLERSKRLVELYHSYRFDQLKQFIGSKQAIVWTQEVNGKYLGRTPNYTLVESKEKSETIKGVEGHHLVS
ncbi:tRNA (N(6)-L-threonylcarbamoyladenosine(37)-C(2))-methylthiotransferase [Candidatus Woesearchaeota archaeon]|nr:MAG: tRNA (N(6)-L-threonylcarbamoyladenosine(37)-C(2))-methylthiotransferase [Candidatus Woesearchaeota archaeon]